MINFIEKLKKNELFGNLSIEDYKIALDPDSCIIGHYKKNAVIMQENEPCRSVGYIVEGALSVQQLSPSGETVKIEMLKQGDCFGPALLFSPKPFYPYTLITSKSTIIAYIQFFQIEELIKKSDAFSKNYIQLLSGRILTFQHKIRILSQNDVRSRLILYFSEELEKTGKPSFQLVNSKAEIADLIGVARPSVSRELKRMQEDHLIAVDRDTVTIIKTQLFHFNYH